MNHTSSLLYLFLSLFLLRCAPPAELPEASPDGPSENIIVFLVDDLGWTDLSGYGSDLYETPNIDRLAQQGVKFTNAYSACTVCSPTRAAMMTGKYPARLHLTDWIAGRENEYGKLRVPDWTKYLPTQEVTLAELAKEAHYATASIGKWHLGDDSIYYPQYQGFDVNVAGYKRGQPPSYFYPYVRGQNALPYLEGGHEGEYLTDRLTQEACRFIRQHARDPFFLYFPHYAVHTPIQAQDSVTEYYRTKVKPGMQHFNPEYAAMIHSTDKSMGRLLQLLDSLSLSERTTIIFASDNGGRSFQGKITNNAPLRAGKGSAYEGGVRVPMIIKRPRNPWPGAVIDEPVITMDAFATVADLMTSPTQPLPDYQDGVSLRNILEDTTATLDRDALFWHYPHYHSGGARPYSAIRQGSFKLIEFLEDNHLELYDLDEDIGETTNLMEALPEVANELYDRLAAWRNEVGAQMPTANPAYDSLRAQDYFSL